MADLLLQAIPGVHVEVLGIGIPAGFISPVVGDTGDESPGRLQDAPDLGQEGSWSGDVLKSLEGHHHIDAGVG